MRPKDRRVPVELLEECCERLKAGEDIPTCLERNRDFVGQLEAQLVVVALLRQAREMPAREVTVATHARTQFVQAALRMAPSPVSPVRPSGLAAAWEFFLQSLSQVLASLRPIPAGLVLTLTVVLMLGLLTTGTVTASANAMPGQFLYPVKLATEQVRLRLALNPTTQGLVAAQIDENRRGEARQVLAQHLRVDRLACAGVVESMQGGKWTISGLTVLITGASVIDGVAHVGDRVRGEVRAPGDGTLVALKLIVDRIDRSVPPDFAPASGGAGAVALTLTPTPPPTALPPTIATLVAIPTLSISRGEAGLARKPTLEAEPTAVPTSTEAATPTATATATPRPTFTPTPSLTPMRTVTHGKIIDVVRAINGSRWTIGSQGVETDGSTQFIDSPGLGDKVDATVAMMPDGSVLAESIRALREPPGEKFDTTGIVNMMSPTRWDVDGTIFTVGGDTGIDSGIQLHDYANVQAERRAGGQNHALRIKRLVEGTTQFSGPIESMGGSHWVIMGKTVTTDAKTVYGGGPAAVGRIADVEALIMRGALVARLIYVQADTPTPPPTPTDKPVAPEPTHTPTPPPAPTDTPVPPKPTRTPTPLPTCDVSALPHTETGGGRV